MFRMTLTLVVALYVGLVIWGDPADEAAAAIEAAPLEIATAADYATPTILRADAGGEPAPAVAVTRGASGDTSVAAAIAASTSAAGDLEPRRIGEPLIVSLVTPDAPLATPPTARADADGVPIATAATSLVEVTGSRVNMRRGPSTGEAVVDSLPRGTLAEAVGAPVNGWQEIRDIATGRSGWMSARFLAPA